MHALVLISMPCDIFGGMARSHDLTERNVLPVAMRVAVKAKDDLRQEQLASQFFTLAHKILRESPLGSRAGLR